MNESIHEELRRRGSATWSPRLGLASCVLGFCVCPWSLKGVTPPPGKPEAYLVGFTLVRIVALSIPSLLALAGLVTGVRAWRDRYHRDLAAWGLLFSIVYLLVAWGLGAYMLLSGRAEPPSIHEGREPVRPAEARDFALQVEATIRAGDPDFLDGRLDVDALAEKVVGHALGPIARAKVHKEFQRNGLWFGAQIAREIERGGDYRLLRLRSRQGQPTAVFRYLADGINYHELYLCRGADGGVSYDDLYSLSGDFLLSEMAARAQQETRADQRALGQFTDLIRRGRYQEVLRRWDALPKALRATPQLALLRLRAAGQVSDTAYLDALTEIEQLHGSDPAVALVLMDLVLERGSYQQCLDLIDQVDGAIGGDPALDSMRAYVLLAAERLPEARAAAALGVEGAGELQFTHEAALEVALAARDHPTTLRTLCVLRDTFHVNHGDLTTTPGFESFLCSNEYQAWIAPNDSTPDDTTLGTPTGSLAPELSSEPR